MSRMRPAIPESERRQIGELLREKIAYHEAGHAVCLLHCGVRVKGLYLAPARMPIGSPPGHGCCDTDLQNNEWAHLIFGCAGACYAEELAPSLSELRRIAVVHPSASVQNDMKKLLRVARAEYNAVLSEYAAMQAGPYGVSVARMRVILKEDWEPEHQAFCESIPFTNAVQVLAQRLLEDHTITSQEVLSGQFLNIPVLARK